MPSEKQEYNQATQQIVRQQDLPRIPLPKEIEREFLPNQAVKKPSKPPAIDAGPAAAPAPVYGSKHSRV